MPWTAKFARMEDSGKHLTVYWTSILWRISTEQWRIGDCQTRPPWFPIQGQLVTDENGFLFFSCIIRKETVHWSEVELKATVEVEGTETSVSETYTLQVLADDVEDISITPPGGVDSPYGTAHDVIVRHDATRLIQ